MSDKNQYSVTVEEGVGLYKIITNILTQINLGYKRRCPYNPRLLKLAFQRITEGKFYDNKIVKDISPEFLLEIDKLSGKQLIEHANYVFSSYISNDFSRSSNHRALIKQTPVTPVRVYEQINDATLPQMFTSFSSDLSRIILTENQVINFCDKNFNWLAGGDSNATYFLLEDFYEQYYVAEVDFFSTTSCINGLRIIKKPFGFSRIKRGYRKHRIIIPCLEL